MTIASENLSPRLRAMFDAEKATLAMPAAEKAAVMAAIATQLPPLIPSPGGGATGAPVAGDGGAGAAVGAAKGLAVSKALIAAFVCAVVGGMGLGAGLHAWWIGGKGQPAIQDNINKNNTLSNNPPVLVTPQGPQQSAAVADDPRTEAGSPDARPAADRVAAKPIRPRAKDHGRLVLDRANAALSRGKPAEALRVLRSHQRRFPRSQYGQIRDALVVRVLVDLGRCDEAKAQVRRSARHDRHNPLLPQLRRKLDSCSSGSIK